MQYCPYLCFLYKMDVKKATIKESSLDNHANQLHIFIIIYRLRFVITINLIHDINFNRFDMLGKLK